MTAEEKKNSPAYKCSAYEAMSAKWPYVSDVIEGTLKMRREKQKYLPRFPREHPDSYADRLNSAVCFDATGTTKKGLVGLIFRKDPTLGDKTPKQIVDQLENVNLAGTHWTVFAKEVADAAWEYGHSFIVVDMPPSIEGATHAVDFDPAFRPYWLHYKPNQAINWNTVQAGGQTILEQITFEECTTEKDGRFANKPVTRYRVFFLEGGEVKWELQRKVKNDRGEEVTIIEDKGALRNVTEIPLSVVYAEKTGFLTSCPPLLKLALLNIKHYQQQSEYDYTLHVCGYPILCADDADMEENKEGDKERGVGSGLQYSVPKGCDVWYAEPAGSSLEAQAKNLETKKQEMAAMGISFLAEKVQVEETATEQNIKSGERTSALATMQRSLKDALERSIGFHGQFIRMKAEQSGTVEMADPSELVLSTEDIRLLSDLIMRGQLDNETMWAAMKKAGRLPSNFDPELVRNNIGQIQPTL